MLWRDHEDELFTKRHQNPLNQNSNFNQLLIRRKRKTVAKLERVGSEMVDRWCPNDAQNLTRYAIRLKNCDFTSGFNWQAASALPTLPNWFIGKVTFTVRSLKLTMVIQNAAQQMSRFSVR